jgi:methanogenic corrinoid protein MtbC1
VSDDDYDEIDLATLPDDELVKQMHDDLYDGLADEIVEGVTILLDRNWGADKVLNDALVEGMRIVGIDFRDGILFVPEVLLAANAMKAGMELLRPLLAETGAEPIGKIVIGTVKGDIHDIGKNLTAMMMEGAGFEVVDLGINCDVDKYLDALEQHQPDILGMSALLTTTMPYMKVVIDTLVERGTREDFIVLVGGAPLNEEFGEAIGADRYCRDAAVAAETAKQLVLARRGAVEPAGPSVRSCWSCHEHGTAHVGDRLRCAGPRAARHRAAQRARRAVDRVPARRLAQPAERDPRRGP